jgi:hypothetical protein
MSIKLCPGNTHWIQVFDLTRMDTGEFLDEATVEVTVYYCDSETAVSGETWPVELTAGDDGYYSSTTSSEADIEDKEKYTVKVTATMGDNVGTWQKTVLAQARRF